MKPLRRLTTSEKEKNQLILLQHAIFAGVFRTPRESLDYNYIIYELERLAGVSQHRKPDNPSLWEFDKLQRQLTTKLEEADYVEFRRVLSELDTVLKTARANAFKARTEKAQAS